MEYDLIYKDKKSDYFSDERSEIAGFVPPDVKLLLDIGCGTGAFGAYLKKNRPNLRVWGIEPHVESAEIAKEQLDHVICGIFDNDLMGLDKQVFDCITFNDVLEHIQKPELALKACQSMMHSSSILIASVPNVLFFPVMYDLLVNGDWKYTSSGVLDNTHVRFFTKKSLVRMFEENGFEIIKITGINIKTHVQFRLYRILNLLLFNHLKDWKYMQFVVVVKKAR